MINRLPKEFRLPAAGDVKNGASRGFADSAMVQRFASSAARCIGQYPIAALSAAFLAGLVAGRIVKR